jgi:uncharacterized protein (DUF488 family)
MSHIFTIGYEGTTPDRLMAALFAHDVSLLIDVRLRPASRRPEFSEPALSHRFEPTRIRYEHWPILGNPEKAGGEHILDHLRTRDAQEALDVLARHLRDHGPIALLCMERSASTCHRRHVAETLGRHADAPITHLIAIRPASLLEEDFCSP